MSLVRIGGALLKLGNLVNDCCCKFACLISGYDECGQPQYECKTSGDGEYTEKTCNDDCPETPPCCPCECGEICIDGVCYPCPPEYTVVGCECIPYPPPPDPEPNYYCCYNYNGPEPGTETGAATQEEMEASGTACQVGPCGKIVDGAFVPQAWRTAGGPYTSGLDCADACRPHSCNQKCGKEQCVPDAGGQHRTRDKCFDSCDDPAQNPCNLSPGNPITYSGAGAGTWNYYFTIDEAAGRPVCVTYVSKCGQPISVQIFSPSLNDNCEVILERGVQVNSGWRGKATCDCNPEPPPGGYKGIPRGYIKWKTKQFGVTSFEVQVITLCDDTEWEITVTCGDCDQNTPAWRCCCGCSIAFDGHGCFHLIDDADDDDMVTISWNDLQVPNFAPIGGASGEGLWADTNYTQADLDNGTTPQPYKYLAGGYSAGAKPVRECWVDANGIYHLRGWITTWEYTTDSCENFSVWRWEYDFQPENDFGGAATVFLEAAITNIPPGAEVLCEVPTPTVTITIAP